LYKFNVPFTDYMGRKRTQDVAFNLDAREVFKMLPELKSVFDWMETNKNADVRELSTQEVTNFYTDFEGILLSAWGEISEDGLHFRKGGKYDFEESAAFNACMVMFVMQPEKTGKLIEGILPPEMFEMVKNADPETLEAATNSRVAEQEAEIARLKAQLEAPEKSA
jgi:hypothetical protein